MELDKLIDKERLQEIADSLGYKKKISTLLIQVRYYKEKVFLIDALSRGLSEEKARHIWYNTELVYTNRDIRNAYEFMINPNPKLENCMTQKGEAMKKILEAYLEGRVPREDRNIEESEYLLTG